MIKKNIKLLIGIIIGGIVFGSIGVYGAGKLYASSIDVDTSKMSELGETSNVNLALNYLYGKAATVTASLLGEKKIITLGNKGVIAILYMDPTSLTRNCKESDVVSTTGTKTGCMKWYIYKEDSTSYTAILDHNTTATVAYNSSNVNTTPKEVATQLTSDTSSWDSSLNARLITANEVAEIVGLSNWDSSTATSSNYFFFDTKTSNRDKTIDAVGESSYGWLFDYTNSCTAYGCNTSDSSTYGYRTSTAVNGSGSSVWYVGFGGALGNVDADRTSYGVRPVIEIPKTLFN